MSARPCPTCAGETHHGVLGALSLDLCLACAGAWFDFGELQSLIQAGPDVVRRLGAHLFRSRGAPTGQRFPHCPTCAIPLSTGPVSEHAGPAARHLHRLPRLLADRRPVVRGGVATGCGAGETRGQSGAQIARGPCSIPRVAFARGRRRAGGGCAPLLLPDSSRARCGSSLERPAACPHSRSAPSHSRAGKHARRL